MHSRCIKRVVIEFKINTILLNNQIQTEISHLLIRWYNENRRDLPWRETNDPYKIWVSEVMLQQTRVAQGLNYYLRFIEKFPSVKLLAQSSEKEVLKMWQGLGYYSRARNMHSAAKTIVSNYNSKIPNTYREIITLKGIGEYTAAAVLSIAFNKPYAVVDGNVYRLLSRLFAIDTPIDSTAGKKQFANLAHDLLNTHNPGLHNQAIMDFGAIQCTPALPLCHSCPFRHLCSANKLNIQLKFPIKQNKTKVRKRYFHYFYIEFEGSIYLNKRKSNDIWKNMYEFPLIETDKKMSLSDLMKTASFNTLFSDAEITFHQKLKTQKHLLTHQHIYVNFYEVEMTKPIANFVDSFLRINTSDINNFPISRLIQKYLESRELLPK